MIRATGGYGGDFMREETMAELRRIATPKAFAKNEYICYEGQPGDEMYIILKGSVGVFLVNAVGALNQVAVIESGNFFGEMAIFDNLPRSASCIALEDTVTVAITQENLQEFLAACPDMAKQILENMSGRIRKLDEELYQNNRFVKNRHVPRFAIPAEYRGGHVVRKEYQDPQRIREYKQACPICGKAVTVKDLKRNIAEVQEFSMDCRIHYVGVEPLWLEVISCPYCHYTNHYLKFFGINNFEFQEVEKVLWNEHKPIVEARFEKRTDFDILVMQYLQAIHINEHVNAGGNVLIGNLWRSLYWLAKDANDREFGMYCAGRAMEKYLSAMKEDCFFDKTERAVTALSYVNLSVYRNEWDEVLRYIDIALDCPEERITENAQKLKAQIERRLKKE